MPPDYNMCFTLAVKWHFFQIRIRWGCGMFETCMTQWDTWWWCHGLSLRVATHCNVVFIWPCLKPAWHSEILDGGVMVCLFALQLTVELRCVHMTMLESGSGSLGVQFCLFLSCLFMFQTPRSLLSLWWTWAGGRTCSVRQASLQHVWLWHRPSSEVSFKA